ncbi:chloride channel protein [Testudinibacter sp. TR-2022]|uniref:chloride channel protein n=1 Tax=Testudinibacter sp. TR-2022 TaxID=2585029 RepID=UPI00111B99CB|nr:chloride channel protein [Testudinibacter sp. TR-2022]TNH09177.1 chloride channel protein [Pasteurellaceae bacterium Phil11]TNH23557.1 chloride channel protein [Testudinibacter sp. TR-2022]TNH23736.1 chloride channel protein [Testudinibacter sp. TR-2022]
MQIRFRFFISLLIIGVVAGLVGFALTELMHFVQHHAFDYSLHGESLPFRLGVEQAAPSRRWWVLLLCGVSVGFGWYAIQRYGAKLVGFKAAMAAPQQGMPFFTTISHALLQIVTVGLGSPLGRETAPREMSAAFASLWIRKIKLNDDDAALLIACAAGAGLAAVYNVPLAATIFILETLVVAINARVVFAALLTSVTATMVVRYTLGDLVQYHLSNPEINQPLLWFALLFGLLITPLVKLFRYTTALVPFLPRTDKRIVPLAMLLFSLIGAVAIFFPDVLGNGKAGNQLVFAGLLNWHEGLVLLLMKWLVVLLALAAGAYGGLITPSMMLGSILAFSLAFAWNAFLPSISIESAALIGAAAFLAISLKMPLTAIVFAVELTRSSAAMLLPLALAVASAWMVEKWLFDKAKTAL